MEWKVPASYCIHCGDLKRLCRCNGKAATVEAKDSGFVQLKQEESGRELDKVDNSMKVSDKLDKVKEEATGTKISQDNQRSVFKAREILKELENSNIVPPFSNSSLENEESKISENISHSVYETFGVRLRSKEKLSTVENMAQTLNKDSINDGKSKEENESHSVSNWEENEPNKQQTRHVSDAIASKLVLFDSPDQSESAIPQKISYSCTKGATCVVCRRSVHPIEKFLSPNGELYHMNCLRCSICQCLLDSSCLNCFENNFLCNKCFVKKPRSIPNNRSSSYINPFGKLLDRIAVIVSKNFKLSFRNLIAVALQILVPLLFTFFIFAAKLSYTHNSIFKIYVSPDTDPKSHSMQNIPRCIPFRTSHCYTMAYVPSIGIGHNVTSGQTKTLNVSYWIEQLAVENNIPASEIISFANSSDLNEFLYENQNTTQAAFIFEQENLDDIASGNISFIVQYNQTKQCDFPSSSFCYYQEEYLIPNMIRAMNEYLMKNLTGKNVQLNFSRSIFPHPAISGELNAFREYGPFLLFGVYMLNFVFFLGELVNEKELKLRESMKMAGLGQAMYMSTWFVTFFVSMLLTSFLLIAFGAAFQFELYLSTAFGNYFLTFWIFSMALICWAFLFSTFTPKSSQVNYVGFVFFIVGYLIASSSPYVYGTESSGKPYLKSDLFFLRYLFALIPSTMFYKGVYDMATYAISGHGLTWSERSSYTNTFPLTTCWVWMIWTSIVVMVLAVYLDNILPNEFGSRLPWYYPFSKYYWFGGRIAAKRRQHQMQSNLELNSSFAPVEESSAEILSESSKEHMQRGNFSLGPEITVEESQSLGQSSHDRVAEGDRPSSERNLSRVLTGEGEDEDVILEERSIKSGRIRNTAVVVINQLYKEFRTGFRKKFVAVNGLSLAIDEGHLFCLLGHNGAGKSTTFNILTGVLKATCGDALIYSHSVAHEQSEIRRIMGVCPQHDILWKRLTGAEHVNLFATLKDIPHSKRKAEVEYRLNQVGLFEVGTKFASQYSGGMQRRLSVAIALTGDPKIVFLDEPTTGMDPVSRRHAWEMIEAAKAGRVIVLTTHSMEEADVLGDRIGIMSKGRLRCLGTPLHLKNKFGTGYRLVILCKEENVVRKFVTRNIPETEETEMTKTPSNLIVLTFVLPRGISQKLAEFFSSLERQKDALEISDYSISMSSLEEVFLKVASQENVDAIQNTDSQNSLWNRIRRWFRKPLP